MFSVLLPRRVFGNSWDSDEDAPTRPQAQRRMPKLADSRGCCNHQEDSINGETEAQRGTMTHQGQAAVATVSGGEGTWGHER